MGSIAVCISGQVRNDDSALAQTADSLKGLGVDVFFSVWENRGTKTFGGASGPDHMARIFGPEISGAIPKNWLGRMREVFPESGAIFPSLGAVTEGALRKYFPDAEIDIEPETLDLSFPYSDSNSLRMLYKIWRCNALKRSAEKRLGKRYDIVVRMRPDITLDFNRIKNLTLQADEIVTHAHGQAAQNYVQDIYWVGSSASDDAMAAAFSRAVSCRDRGWEGIHVELANHIKRHSLQEKPASYVTGNIHHFASFDPDYAKAVQDRFVQAVKNREMNVPFAGGEAFCALAETALDSALAQVRGEPEMEDFGPYLREIEAFTTHSRSLSKIAQFMGAQHLMSMRRLEFPVRFGLLMFLLKNEMRMGMKPVWESLINSIPVYFAGKERMFLKYLARPARDHAGHSAVLPESWKEPNITDVIDVAETEAALGVMLKKEFVCNWAARGAGIERNAENVLALVLRRIEIGVESQNNYNLGAAAYRQLGDVASEAAFLEKADGMADVSAVKARLGELAFKREDFETAARYLQAALALPHCPGWVADTLAKAKAAMA